VTLKTLPIGSSPEERRRILNSDLAQIGDTLALIMTGAGSPESAVVAPKGTIFLRTDGGASTTLYVKTSGAGNTGWTAK
jgi:hypothetical protein